MFLLKSCHFLKSSQKLDRKSLLLLFFFTITLYFPPLDAFYITPISQTLSPKGRSAKRSFLIINNKAKTIGIQVNMSIRDMDLYGKEINSEIHNEFLYYPKQLILMPGQRQKVSVTWVGENQPKTELAYRFIAEELPLNLSPQNKKKDKQLISPSIKLFMKFVASVYITPKKAKAEIIVEDISTQESGKKKQLVITLYNKGTKHHLLSKGHLLITEKGEEDENLILTEDAIEKFDEINLLAERRVRLYLNYPDAIKEKNIRAVYEPSKA